MDQKPLPTPSWAHKLDSGLHVLFARANLSQIRLDTRVSCMIKTSGGYRPDTVEIVSQTGNIYTARATLEQLKTVAENDDVLSVSIAQLIGPAAEP